VTAPGPRTWTQAALAGVALALVASLAQPAAADGSSSVMASSLQAVGPDPGTFTGTLTGYFLTAPLPDQSPPPVPPFTVSAAKLHMERDHSVAAVHAATSTELFPQRDTTDLGASTVVETGNGVGYRIFIVPVAGYPAPQATLKGGCTTVQTTPKNTTVRREPEVDASRPPAEVSLATSVLAAACGEVTLTIHGTFLLELWGVDALLQSNGTTAIHSGSTTMSGLPSQSPAYPSTDSEYFLTVYDGTFQSPFGLPQLAYLSSVRATLDGTVILDHASGQIATASGLQVVDNQNLKLRGGAMQVAIEGHGADPMLVTFANDWRQAVVGDSPVAPSGAQASPSPALALGGVLLLAAAWTVRRTRG